MTITFKEVAIRIWRSGSRVLTQATPNSMLQLWDVYREDSVRRFMKNIGEFSSIQKAIDYLEGIDNAIVQS